MKHKKEFTSMQFIDINSGRRCNYAPDSPPSTYTNVANIIALFHVKKRYNEWSFRFSLFGKRYVIEILSN